LNIKCLYLCVCFCSLVVHPLFLFSSLPCSSTSLQRYQGISQFFPVKCFSGKKSHFSHPLFVFLTKYCHHITSHHASHHITSPSLWVVISFRKKPPSQTTVFVCKQNLMLLASFKNFFFFFFIKLAEIFLDYVPQYRVIYHFLNYILNQLQYYLKSLIYLLCQVQTPHYQFHENTLE